MLSVALLSWGHSTYFIAMKSKVLGWSEWRDQRLMATQQGESEEELWWSLHVLSPILFTHKYISGPKVKGHLGHFWSEPISSCQGERLEVWNLILASPCSSPALVLGWLPTNGLGGVQSKANKGATAASSLKEHGGRGVPQRQWLIRASTARFQFYTWETSHI